LLDLIAAGLGQSAAQAAKGPPSRLPELVCSIYALFTVLILFRSLSLFHIQFSVMDKSSLDFSVPALPKATARCHLQYLLRLNFQLLGLGKTGGCLSAPPFPSLPGPSILHVMWNILRPALRTSPGDFTYASRLSCTLFAFAKTEEHVTADKTTPLFVKLALVGSVLLTCALLSPVETATLAHVSSLLLFL
jgi:hypothetical protein